MRIDLSTVASKVNGTAPTPAVGIGIPVAGSWLRDYDTVVSSPAFTINGSPAPTIEKISGDSKVTWNSVTRCLDIEPGLAAGTYTTRLRASNSLPPDFEFSWTFKITVPPVPPGTVSGMGILNILKENAGGMSSGAYTFSAGGQSYPMDVVVYNGNTVFTTTQNFGGATDARGLVVIVNGNCTINPGVTLQPSSRRRGFFLFVTGKLTNNGTISMTARGATAPNQDVHLWQNGNGSMETVPGVGATGGAGKTSGYNVGANGVGRQLGGGGSGASTKSNGGNSGGRATSYSGGAGGGGAHAGAYADTVYGSAGSSTGGAGGTGNAEGAYGYPKAASGGGAGNPGGEGNVGQNGGNNVRGVSGTGGLLVVYGKSVREGSMTSIGSRGGPTGSVSGTLGARGGNSGSGSINIFYEDSIEIGFCNVSAEASGISGGAGTVTRTQIAA